MIKYIIGLLVSMIAVMFFRTMMSLLTKVAKDALNEQTAPPTADAPEKGTMLRKCKSCGLFAPESRMLRHSTKESDLFYCSKDCEAKAA